MKAQCISDFQKTKTARPTNILDCRRSAFRQVDVKICPPNFVRNLCAAVGGEYGHPCGVPAIHTMRFLIGIRLIGIQSEWILFYIKTHYICFLSDYEPEEAAHGRRTRQVIPLLFQEDV
jgi:hypothetical protein